MCAQEIRESVCCYSHSLYFFLQKVKVGTRAEKRTTIPLLYNLEGSVDGLDVIDFPGVDDRDHTVPELANLLLSLAQIIVFVVDYRLVKLYNSNIAVSITLQQHTCNVILCSN